MSCTPGPNARSVPVESLLIDKGIFSQLIPAFSNPVRILPLWAFLCLDPIITTMETCASTAETGQLSPTERSILLGERMGKIGKKIIVFSGKGGVGKTTVAVNLAAALMKKGCKVGILDADIHGPNVPKMLGIEDVKPDVSCRGILPVEAHLAGGTLKVISIAFFIDKDSPVIWRAHEGRHHTAVPFRSRMGRT